MSTYVRNFRVSQTDAPDFLKEYLSYVVSTLHHSPRTANTYYILLRDFFRWVLLTRNGSMTAGIDPRTVSIATIGFVQVETISTPDIIQYLSLCEEQGDKASTRALKLAAIRKFFDYYTKITKRLGENPAEVIPSPSTTSKLPVYLTEDECLAILAAVDGPEAERDYCIMTILMNCGLRLSELVALNLSNIQQDGLIRVVGKGDKERQLYLNEACQSALHDYLEERGLTLESHVEAPLFVSRRTGQRITGRRVQQIMQELLLKAGLSGRGYSPHKLRHTAATLMYQKNGTDIRVLQHILGHDSISTTEIYTHVSDEQVISTMKHSPLATVRKA